MTLADRIVVMQGGQARAVRSPNGLLQPARSLFVAGFVGSPPMNFLPARIDDGGTLVDLAGGVDVPAPARLASPTAQGGRAVIGLRPEHVRFAAGGDGARVPGHRRARRAARLRDARAGAWWATTAAVTGRFPAEAG